MIIFSHLVLRRQISSTVISTHYILKVSDYNLGKSICMAWCPDYNSCVNVSPDGNGSDTCNGKCLDNYNIEYCGVTNRCIEESQPCGDECLNDYHYFCPSTNKCQSKSRSCNGECPPGRRYCPRYKVSWSIYVPGVPGKSCTNCCCLKQCVQLFSGTPSRTCKNLFRLMTILVMVKDLVLTIVNHVETNVLLENFVQPKIHVWWEQILQSTQIKMLLQESSSCVCPEDKWPAADCGPVKKCSLFSNQTLPKEVSRCSILVHESCSSSGCGSTSTSIKGGDCHPSYVFCEETQSCNPLLYSACGYSEWLQTFFLEECTQLAKRNVTKNVQDCVEKSIKHSILNESKN